MPQKHSANDRNFDPLTERFKRNIYDSPKGQIRLAVLERDFDQFLSLKDKRVLDLGAGQGQFAKCMLARGAQVALLDHSAQMLAQASALLEEAGAMEQASLIHGDLWDYTLWPKGFEVITCHAVLEWLEDPLAAVSVMCKQLPVGGYLSLMFYNLDGLIYKNLLRGNYKKVLTKDFRGQRGSLTPNSPLAVQDVLRRVAGEGLSVLCHSGVRCFHDYIFDREVQAKAFEQAMALELEYSRIPPYRDLGRYVHLLLHKGRGRDLNTVEMASPAGIEPTSKP